jgi:hypothetical protein
MPEQVGGGSDVSDEPDVAGFVQAAQSVDATN